MAKTKKAAARRAVEQFRQNVELAVARDGRSVSAISHASGLSHTTLLRALETNRNGMFVLSIVLLAHTLGVNPVSLFRGVKLE